MPVGRRRGSAGRRRPWKLEAERLSEGRKLVKRPELRGLMGSEAGWGEGKAEEGEGAREVKAIQEDNKKELEEKL